MFPLLRNEIRIFDNTSSNRNVRIVNNASSNRKQNKNCGQCWLIKNKIKIMIKVNTNQ